jgi:hypothetical protein
MDSKKVNKIINKVTEWVNRGIEVKKIQDTAWKNWGVMSEVKDGQIIMTVWTSERDGRGGYRYNGEQTIGSVKL